MGLGPRDTDTHHIPFNKENTSISQLLDVSKCKRKHNWLEVKNMTWKVEEDVQELESLSN